jgi:opacity protein-like surface antigen
MAKLSTVVVAAVAIILLAGSAMAQDEEEKTFNLIVGDDAAEEITEEMTEEPAFQPEIKKGQWDLTLTLGYFNMTDTMLQHPNLIYKATDEAFFYGDITINGEAAFNPILRLGYNLTTWLALELQGGVTFSEYTADIANPMQVNPEGGNPQPVTEVGEFDAENRSTLIFIGNINGLWYPLNMDGDGRGRWHPYITGGVGVATYNLDSNYVAGPSSGFNLDVGVGIRLIADELVSVRAEILYQTHTIQFEPADYFDELEGGTVTIPVYEFDDAGRYSPVREFSSNTLGGITWQIGFAINL